MPDLGSLLLVVVEVRDHAHAGDRDAGRGHSLEAARHHQPREGAHRGKHCEVSKFSFIYRDGEVTFEKELSSSSSYFQMRHLGT